MTRTPDIGRLRSPGGHCIGPEALQGTLAAGGYPADQCEQVPKAVPTEPIRDGDTAPQARSRAALIDDIRSILPDQQANGRRPPIPDDTP
ncbi:hypothetical protein P1J78_18580 [Psychromarinibacter sp. C21-152]|uniref:Uncharacterized protein n=1 Tax=Psychromarinibacter sediminicola TaxID=3033385 RepID=A0AAE3NUX8_9RHOB|nr:hypothetical protein [Psychromarinibacter sediminicola]MDF0602751.1 hypothetical protein [Psychromarinibacter sediminicola]